MRAATRRAPRSRSAWWIRRHRPWSSLAPSRRKPPVRPERSSPTRPPRSTPSTARLCRCACRRRAPSSRLARRPVTCTAIDTRGNVATAGFTVVVVDTIAPALNVPGDITLEATGPVGAAVVHAATATDGVDGAIAPVCVPASGAVFPVGATPVTCTATDTHGNATSGTFSVAVVDTTPPVLALPANITAVATSDAGAVVTYAATASDLVDGVVAAICTPESGSTFPVGTTTVTCFATDAAGNAASGTFTVTVRRPPIPTPTRSPSRRSRCSPRSICALGAEHRPLALRGAVHAGRGQRRHRPARRTGRRHVGRRLMDRSRWRVPPHAFRRLR